MTVAPLGDVVVCVVSSGGGDPVGATLQELRARTPDAVPVVEVDSESAALASAAPSDVVLVHAGCAVAPDWLDGLRAAAYAGDTIATAAALSQHDVAAELDRARLDAAAGALGAGSLRLRPRVPRLAGPCVYVRRSAIELVGAGEDFGRRCVERGLSHVLADDVLVLDPDPADRADADRLSGPVARALAAARRSLGGLSVVIDARILLGPTTGTHVHVLELIGGLAGVEGVRLTAIVPDEPSEHALARLEALPGVSLVTYREASAGVGAGADIVHRPFQLSNAGDLTFLRSLGDRVILTQQDLIAFHNPSYFPTPEAWQAYRELTRVALASVDRVAFFSAHARDDALGEDLVAPARASVVHLGVDHPGSPSGASEASGTPAPSLPPAAAERLGPSTPAMLCLGTDFHHKNRVFALRMLAALRRIHGWDGVLVFAGPTVAHGSSRPQERQLAAAHPELADAVLDLGAVSEAEKHWLFERCALVLYPSVVEGFGLVPFEAAAHRVPCMWAPGSSLSELLPDDAAEIVSWDEHRSAEHALALLADGPARERNLTALDAAASGLSWEATARRLAEVYRETADAPAQLPVHAGAAMSGLLSEDAARLVGPGGELPADVERPLLALATHRHVAAPLFGALKLGYRVAYELRRRRQRRR